MKKRDGQNFRFHRMCKVKVIESMPWKGRILEKEGVCYSVQEIYLKVRVEKVMSQHKPLLLSIVNRSRDQTPNPSISLTLSLRQCRWSHLRLSSFYQSVSQPRFLLCSFGTGKEDFLFFFSGDKKASKEKGVKKTDDVGQRCRYFFLSSPLLFLAASSGFFLLPYSPSFIFGCGLDQFGLIIGTREDFVAETAWLVQDYT